MAGNFLELGARLGEPLVVFGLRFWARGSRLPGRSKFRTLAMVEHMEEESPKQGDRRIDAFAFVLRTRDFGKEIGGPQTAQQSDEIRQGRSRSCGNPQATRLDLEVVARLCKVRGK